MLAQGLLLSAQLGIAVGMALETACPALMQSASPGFVQWKRGRLEGGRRKGRFSPTLPAPGGVCPWLQSLLGRPVAPGLVGLSALTPLWAASCPCAWLLSCSTLCVASALSVSSPWLNLTVTQVEKEEAIGQVL